MRVSVSLFFGLVTGLSAIQGAENARPPLAPRLSGIVNLSDRKVAVLEVPADGLHRSEHSLILSERQRDGEIEVVRILPERRAVKLNVYPQKNLELSLTNTPADTTTNSFALEFENASLEPVLALYSELSKRTLLRWPQLPGLSFSVFAPAADQAAAALALQRALNEKGLATLPDGEKFTMIVPQQHAASLKPRSSEIKPLEALGSEMLPPGAIDFRGLHIHQVVLVYLDLCRRKLDQSVPMPPVKDDFIYFRTQTDLSRAEAIYALDTLLGWAGIKMVPSGESEMKPVRLDGTIENPAR